MDRLLEGYRRFRAEIWPQERGRYEALARHGQNPENLIITCSDSRVDPQPIFGASPGDLFVVRNVAGLVPPYRPDANYHGTSAALEFAVRVLKVRTIAVMGHAQCGGVQALRGGAPAEAQDFVAPWMSIAAPALTGLPAHKDEEEEAAQCEMAVVRLSLANLMTFPWIREAVAARRLALAGFRFDISSGILTQLEGDAFVPVR